MILRAKHNLVGVGVVLSSGEPGTCTIKLAAKSIGKALNIPNIGEEMCKESLYSQVIKDYIVSEILKNLDETCRASNLKNLPKILHNFHSLKPKVGSLERVAQTYSL